MRKEERLEKEDQEKRIGNMWDSMILDYFSINRSHFHNSSFLQDLTYNPRIDSIRI